MKLVLTLTLVHSLAFAKPPQQQGEPARPRPSQAAKNSSQFFERLDSDKNGTIEFEEFSNNPRLARATSEQQQTLFNRLDKNQDGKLSRNEVKPPNARKHPIQWLRNGPIDYETFAKRPQIVKLQEKHRRRLFQRLDRNSDGVLDKKDTPRNLRKKPRNEKKKSSPFPSLGFGQRRQDQSE